MVLHFPYFSDADLIFTFSLAANPSLLRRKAYLQGRFSGPSGKHTAWFFEAKKPSGLRILNYTARSDQIHLLVPVRLAGDHMRVWKGRPAHGFAGGLSPSYSRVILSLITFEVPTSFFTLK
jgi:hypothetical protein